MRSVSTSTFTIGFPIVLLLIDYLQQRTFDGKTIAEKLPYFALSILFGIIALGGKSDIVSVMTLFEKILLSLKSMSFYLYKFIAPLNLSVFYPQLTDISLMNTEFIISILIALSLVGYIIHAHRKENRIHIFALLFFLITIAFFSSELLHNCQAANLKKVSICRLIPELPLKVEMLMVCLHHKPREQSRL